jgi:hypothetical protein
MFIDVLLLVLFLMCVSPVNSSRFFLFHCPDHKTKYDFMGKAMWPWQGILLLRLCKLFMKRNQSIKILTISDSKKKAQRRKRGVGVKGSERGQSRCKGGIKVESRVEREEGLEGPWVAKFSERCQVVHVLPHVSSLVCKSM